MSSIELMDKRENEIGELLSYFSEKSNLFTKPKIVVIGGYALRAFVPFSRYSRDCDFVLKDELSLIEQWVPKGVSVEIVERKSDHAFLRLVKIIKADDKKVKVGLAFMEKQVRGRDNEVFTIDDKFLGDSRKTTIKVGAYELEIFVPSYIDLFLLKVMAARRSDTRDIATLVWKNDVPREIVERLTVLNDTKIFERNLREKIIPDIKNELFLDSWKGTFVTDEFTEEDKQKVVKKLQNLCQ